MIRNPRILALIVATALSAVALVACSDDDDSSRDTTVTITGVHGVAVGETITLQATTVNGTDTGYTWMAADEGVATVDQNGVVSGVADGETEITATGNDSGVIGRHVVVVGSGGGGGTPVVVVTGDVFLEIGATFTYVATTTNGTDASYTWSSDHDAVATVDASTGEVTAVSSGTVTITATGDDTQASGSLDVRVAIDIPNEADWITSGHADVTAEAFRHWDTDGEIPTSCARCHSGAGFEDYLGADGTAPWVVNNPAELGRTVDCNACHNAAASTLSQVTFPSGVTIMDLGGEARCMTCHQGRESGDSVEASIDATMTAAPDTVASALGFRNIHYFAAGATLNAGRVRGGYQYAGQTYDWRFRHVPGYDTCIGCHDPHSLEVRVTECAECHTGVANLDDLKDVRMMASLGNDYDGNGNTTEGIWHEIDGLRTKLMSALQAYASTATGTADLCYSGAGYPYFFIDTNGDGACDATEATFANRYATWTPRLLRAAYNYQVSQKDPGAFAHNAKYIIQLLYDSITDLNTQLTTPVDMTNAVRNDFGHFNGAGEPARHWDMDRQGNPLNEVEPDCARCHGGSEGLHFFLEYGVGKRELEQDNGLDCATCHTDLRDPTGLTAVSAITFPGGVTVDLQTGTDTVSNLCSTCHSGRESAATIDDFIASGEPLEFLNVHYLPAAALRAGVNAAVAYQFGPANTYSAAWSHSPGSGCTYCHDPALSNHTFQVAAKFALAPASGGCRSCHSSATVLQDIKMGRAGIDYDGNGTVGTLEEELAGIAADMWAEIQAAAPSPICYDGVTYPYFFNDTNANDVCDGGEATRTNAYSSWTADLMRGAHNYQIWQKEPGAWAHNFDYLVQVMADTIDHFGGAGTFTGVRPAP